MGEEDLVWIIPTLIVVGFVIFMSFKAYRKDFPVFRGPADFLCALAVSGLIIADIVIYNEYIVSAGFSGNPAIAFVSCAVGAVVCLVLSIFLAVKNSDSKIFGVLVGVYRVSLIAVAIAIVVLAIVIMFLWVINPRTGKKRYYCTKCGEEFFAPSSSDCSAGGRHSFRRIQEN